MALKEPLIAVRRPDYNVDCTSPRILYSAFSHLPKHTSIIMTSIDCSPCVSSEALNQIYLNQKLAT